MVSRSAARRRRFDLDELRHGHVADADEDTEVVGVDAEVVGSIGFLLDRHLVPLSYFPSD